MTKRVTLRASALAACTGLAVVGSAIVILPREGAAAQHGEAARVTREACGEEPEPDCVARLKKACHAKLTFRCYYARKKRIDGPDGPDTPEKADERDDRSIFYDE